jgi:FMN phosphatase YigB (HAD superfamily)
LIKGRKSGSRVSELRLRAVTFDLWLTLIWDTKELEEYWKIRRLINFHRFVNRRTALASSLPEGRTSFNAVRLAMEEVNARIERSYKLDLDVSPEERGRMLFQVLGLKFASGEERDVRERAGKILSDYGWPSKLPHLNPEAQPTLERLRSDFPGIKIGLISNAGRSTRTYTRLLRSLGILKYFDSLTISSEVGYLKPRREIFEQAIRSLSIRPSEAIHVGDSFKLDVFGATSFGMNAALYTGLWHRYDGRYGTILEHIPEDFRPRRGLTVTEVSSLREIPGLLEKPS